MKTAKLLAFVAVLGLAGLAMAQEDAPKKKRKARPKGIMGKIVKVEGANVVIAKRTRGQKETTEVTVATDAETVVIVNRKKASLADLQAGMMAFITPETGTAKKIMARAPGKKGEGGKDRGKGKGRRKGKDKGGAE